MIHSLVGDKICEIDRTQHTLIVMGDKICEIVTVVHRIHSL
jgi:hypothetical protein